MIGRNVSIENARALLSGVQWRAEENKGAMSDLQKTEAFDFIFSSSPHSYTRAIDWNAFVREPDPEVNANYEQPTRDKIQEAKNSWRK